MTTCFFAFRWQALDAALPLVAGNDFSGSSDGVKALYDMLLAVSRLLNSRVSLCVVSL